MIIQPTQADIDSATAKDPNNCALAQAWKRMCGVPDAQIGIDKCYLPMRIRGKMVALRMKTNSETRRVIDHFDRTGKFPPDGLKLYGIPKSETMTSQRHAAKRTRHRWQTLGKSKTKARKKIHIRNASRRAQTVVS
jgi:hypothetical protein